TLGQYYYHSREGLRRAYERAGFEIVETWDSYCTSVFTVRKRADSMVPRMERALRQAAVAGTPEALAAAAEDFARALDDARERRAPLVDSLAGTTPGLKRYAILQRMRRLVRGRGLPGVRRRLTRRRSAPLRLEGPQRVHGLLRRQADAAERLEGEAQPAVTRGVHGEVEPLGAEAGAHGLGHEIGQHHGIEHGRRPGEV